MPQLRIILLGLFGLSCNLLATIEEAEANINDMERGEGSQGVHPEGTGTIKVRNERGIEIELQVVDGHIVGPAQNEQKTPSESCWRSCCSKVGTCMMAPFRYVGSKISDCCSCVGDCFSNFWDWLSDNRWDVIAVSTGVSIVAGGAVLLGLYGHTLTDDHSHDPTCYQKWVCTGSSSYQSCGWQTYCGSNAPAYGGIAMVVVGTVGTIFYGIARCWWERR